MLEARQGPDLCSVTFPWWFKLPQGSKTTTAMSYFMKQQEFPHSILNGSSIKDKS